MDPKPHPFPDGLLILSLTDPGMKTLIDGTNVIKDHGLVGLILERLQSALFCMVYFLDNAPNYLVVGCVIQKRFIYVYIFQLYFFREKNFRKFS